VTVAVGAPNQPPVAVADATPFSGDGGAPSTEPNPAHVRDRRGLFQATLTVTGSFTGGLTETQSATTGAGGVAILTTDGSAKGLGFTFCVSGVTGAGLTYDGTGNAITCNTFRPEAGRRQRRSASIIMRP
jgi:hypothetical protein